MPRRRRAEFCGEAQVGDASAEQGQDLGAQAGGVRGGRGLQPEGGRDVDTGAGRVLGLARGEGGGEGEAETVRRDDEAQEAPARGGATRES